MRSSPTHHSHLETMRAFSLLETLVALAILGVALTSSIALLAQHRAMDQRISAHLQAQRCLEAQYEAIRGGLSIPLMDGEHPIAVLCETSAPIESLSATVLVETLEPPGYYRVVLKVAYWVGRGNFSRQMDVRLWRF